MSCNYNRHQAQRKKDAALAAAFPQGIRCQKCLEYGHWSYECKGKRKILVRPSRTQVMKKKLKDSDSGICFDGKCEMPKKSKSSSKSGSKRDCKDGKCGPRSCKGGKCGPKSCKGGECDDSSESEDSDSDSSSDSSEDSSGSGSDSDSDSDDSSGSGSDSSD